MRCIFKVGIKISQHLQEIINERHPLGIRYPIFQFFINQRTNIFSYMMYYIFRILNTNESYKQNNNFVEGILHVFGLRECVIDLLTSWPHDLLTFSNDDSLDLNKTPLENT